MGEKVEGAKKAADAGKKKVDGGPPSFVFKIDRHCECQGHADEIIKAVKDFPRVERVETDAGGNKLMVIGKVDAAALKARLEEKTKKKVELVSPQSAKKEGRGGGAGGGDKKKDNGAGAKKDDKKAAAGGGKKKDGGGDKKKGREEETTPGGKKKDGGGDRKEDKKGGKKEVAPGGKKKDGSGGKKEDKKEAAPRGEKKILLIKEAAGGVARTREKEAKIHLTVIKISNYGPTIINNFNF